MLAAVVLLLQLGPAQADLPPPTTPAPRAAAPKKAPAPAEEVEEEEEDDLEDEEEVRRPRRSRRSRTGTEEGLGPWAYALGGAALGFAAGCPVGMVGCLALQIVGGVLLVGGYMALILFFCLLQPTTFLVAVPTVLGVGAQAVLTVLTVLGGAALAGVVTWGVLTVLGAGLGGAGGAGWGLLRPQPQGRRAPLVAPAQR